MQVLFSLDLWAHLVSYKGSAVMLSKLSCDMMQPQKLKTIGTACFRVAPTRETSAALRKAPKKGSATWEASQRLNIYRKPYWKRSDLVKAVAFALQIY